MCGIAGFFSSNGLESGLITKMSDIIAHRGPDDSGAALWKTLGTSAPSTETGSDTAQLALGHRRLSILDLSALGHQPMPYKDGRYWLTYNGEIYNHIELRAELESLGYGFTSGTDSEIIPAAYDAWGQECLHRFNGMWAFALFDTQEKILFLARDRFGVKPLYYWAAPDGAFFFGSEIKQFTILPGWDARLNHQRAYDFLVWGVSDHTDETLFEGVYQIAPGHCLTLDLANLPPFDHGRAPVAQWYVLTPQENTLSFEQAAAHFKTLLEDSVRLRLRADVPIGSCLSGGLDSSSIVCLMNALLQENNAQHLQKTFSACSDVASVDERKWIDKVTARTGTDPHFTYPDLAHLFPLSEQITWHQDEPFGSSSIYAQWHVFALARENGVTVMLDGQGADEMLAGYHAFFGARLADLFRSLRWPTLVREALLIHRRHGRSWTWIAAQIADSLMPDQLRGPLRKFSGRTYKAPGWLDLNMLHANPVNPNPPAARSVQGLSRMQLLHTNLQKLLHWEDRDSMAHGIEARVPFLDYRLVEFALGLPADYKIADAITKRVLRTGMSGTIPDEIRDRVDKIGFATPEEIWIKDHAPDLFRSKIEEAIEQSQGLITREALTYFDDVLAGRKPFNFTLWRIINFAQWLRIFSVKV